MDDYKYPVYDAEAANRVTKEIFGSQVQVYYDQSGKPIIPFEIVERAEFKGD